MFTNIENLFDYSVAQFEAIDHLLTMGVGAHFAALVFFLVVSRFVAPNYRVATALSCIVMLSAGFILYGQSNLWSESFAFNGTNYELSDSTFSNGFRYVNWMVTIPCLLTQLLIVMNLKGTEIFKKATILILAAWGMIVTGYIGQLYEVSNITSLLIWGAVSTLCFIVLNWVVGNVIGYNRKHLYGNTGSTIWKVFGLMMFAWTLYPIAYLIPWFMNSADGVVLRQLLFTIADITSKIIYGMMITYIAVQQSAARGYVPAKKVLNLVGYNHDKSVD
ncbi:bacteriorhodopsin-like [Gangjinia marincola]|uniref:Bacteriorhodopsin-like n=1 Tax=Gangjinia marincola TaxID=578463 RepID=A0ABN1MG38_9FLAO